MERIVIDGGNRLQGDIVISGAKNAALPLMAAALLTRDEVVLQNVPLIEDIFVMGELLRVFGARVEVDQARHTVHIQADSITNVDTPAELAKKMRASFLVTGALLGRFGKMSAPHPGGCALGTRPVNVDVRGFKSMGAHITFGEDYYTAESPRLHGARLYLDYPSHTGTENLLMAACLAEGRTTIKHASTEPEVRNLAQLLNSMGARILGAGTSFIEVEGVESLHGAVHRVIPDRIEAGTFAIAAAITGGDITLQDLICVDMDPLTYKLREAGAIVQEDGDTMRVAAPSPLQMVDVQALPFPGFPTDLQAAFAALMTQAHGTSTIFERVYDNRLLYTNELRKMGARIQVTGQTAQITGPTSLKGTGVRALDIRCGASLVLAGLAAEGPTEISDAHHVDRGYEDIVGKLASVGAVIQGYD